VSSVAGKDAMDLDEAEKGRKPCNEAAGLTLLDWYPPGKMVELEPSGPRELLRPKNVPDQLGI
jgi:hypothetical protein